MMQTYLLSLLFYQHVYCESGHSGRKTFVINLGYPDWEMAQDITCLPKRQELVSDATVTQMTLIGMLLPRKRMI